MFTLDNIPPMPATNCPSWCQTDHAVGWALELEDVVSGWFSLESVLRRWDPLHTERLATVPITGEIAGDRFRIDLHQDNEDPAPWAWVEGVGQVTADEARAAAAALLDAAARIESVQAT